jgi:hypothetical protein
MVERFARFTAQAAQAFDSFITGKRATGELDEFFRQMSDTLAELAQVGGQIITMFMQVSQALGPLGMGLLMAVGQFAEFLGNLAEAYPLLTQLTGALLVGGAAFSKIGNIIAGLGTTLPVMLGGWGKLVELLGRLSPSSVAGTAAMQRLSAGLDAAELAAGRYTDRLFTSTAAAERAYTTGARLGGAFTRVASAIPVAGIAVAGLAIAYESLTASADEAADAMLQGGAAAEKVRQDMAWQDAAVKNARTEWKTSVPVLRELAWVTNNVGKAVDWMIDSSDDAAAKARELYNAMTPLGQAQVDATRAANAYGQAVKEHGANSFEAIHAAAQYAAATDRVEQEQRQADEATRSLTDSLVIQRNEMLGSVNADLRAESSRLAVERAQASLAETIARSGEASLDAREAENQYAQALAASVAAAGEAARAHCNAAGRRCLADAHDTKNPGGHANGQE